MTYSVHQHWDPLKVCAVGQSYPPEFYSFITNSRVRDVMERIATETEEDYQKLINLLKSFNVEIVRPKIEKDFSKYFSHGRYYPPIMMTPRDFTAMIGDRFFMPIQSFTSQYNAQKIWDMMKGADWPNLPMNEEQFINLPEWVKKEILSYNIPTNSYSSFETISNLLKEQNNNISYGLDINTAMTTRIGKDLYFGTEAYDEDQSTLKKRAEELFPDYRCHIVNTGGHSDGTFCPVVPGLIVSLYDIPSYTESFPGWEVIYLPGQSWTAVKPFLDLKEKNRGKWWVPGEELNDDFTEFVESWLGHWVGYVEETVFDVNMLVIDEKNVICNNYNEKVFEAFSRYGITPHVVNFRHRYFWDGGLHCVTSDIHREGIQKDYFPERRLT
jgi:hypothetical protein